MNSYPAPWELTGYGYILLYTFGKPMINTLAPDFLKGKALPSLGSVMLVNYETSNCGPYGELLIIPGKYTHEQHQKKEKLNTISKIYVSSQDSVDNGLKNWAIPKELASFEFQPLGKNSEKVTVTTSYNDQQTPIFEATFKQHLIPFPIHTALLPFPLIQQSMGKYYYTKFSGKGLGRLCTLSDLSINPQFFPDITHVKPLAIVKINPFNITFPEAIVRGPHNK
jgi:hypothetical protein